MFLVLFFLKKLKITRKNREGPPSPCWSMTAGLIAPMECNSVVPYQMQFIPPWVMLLLNPGYGSGKQWEQLLSWKTCYLVFQFGGSWGRQVLALMRGRGQLLQGQHTR